MICRKCKYWVFAYKKIVGEDTYFVGECRIRSVPSNSYPERFDYENCWEFSSEEMETSKKEGSISETIVSDTSAKALEFIEIVKRPAARALSSEWDEYIDRIKRILQGE